MNIYKKERLEAAGWTIGDTKDFLQLSEEDSELLIKALQDPSKQCYVVTLVAAK